LTSWRIGGVLKKDPGNWGCFSLFSVELASCRPPNAESSQLAFRFSENLWAASTVPYGVCQEQPLCWLHTAVLTARLHTLRGPWPPSW
jgi:hypothetical protein